MPRVGSTHRCPRCHIRPDLCFCAEVPRLETATRLVIVMHFKEAPTASNTGRLAALCVPGTEIRFRGLPGEAVSGEGLHEPGRTPLLLYPSPESRELNEEFLRELPGPYTLIVPDGSWGQARRVGKREPALQGIRHVRLAPGPLSEYRLRKEPQPSHVCTIEAIARALGVLEGPARGPLVRVELERVLRVMVERTLISRGVVSPRAPSA
jgi:DTW domain-containing protein YfiP